MPDFDDLKKMAEDHSDQVDDAVDKVRQEADDKAGGKDQGMIDKAADGLKDQLDN